MLAGAPFAGRGMRVVPPPAVRARERWHSFCDPPHPGTFAPDHLASMRSAHELPWPLENTDSGDNQPHPANHQVVAFETLVRHFHARLVRETDAGDLLDLPRAVLRQHLVAQVIAMAAEENYVLSEADRERLVDAVASELIGFGPLNAILLDESVNEIMVNGPNEVYVDRNGVVEPCASVAFRDGEHIRDRH